MRSRALDLPSPRCILTILGTWRLQDLRLCSESLGHKFYSTRSPQVERANHSQLIFSQSFQPLDNPRWFTGDHSMRRVAIYSTYATLASTAARSVPPSPPPGPENEIDQYVMLTLRSILARVVSIPLINLRWLQALTGLVRLPNRGPVEASLVNSTTDHSIPSKCNPVICPNCRRRSTTECNSLYDLYPEASRLEGLHAEI